MRRIYTDFKSLQPVGVPQAFEGKAVAAGCFEAVKSGEGRRNAALVTQPGKQNATFFNHRVTALFDAVTQFAACGLGRCFQATAIGRKLPAMKRAAQAATLC